MIKTLLHSLVAFLLIGCLNNLEAKSHIKFSTLNGYQEAGLQFHGDLKESPVALFSNPVNLPSALLADNCDEGKRQMITGGVMLGVSILCFGGAAAMFYSAGLNKEGLILTVGALVAVAVGLGLAAPGIILLAKGGGNMAGCRKKKGNKGGNGEPDNFDDAYLQLGPTNHGMGLSFQF